jgi:acyl carrier protein
LRSRIELEEQLIRLWSEKLELSSVEVNDNFFELGGNSMLAADLLMDIYQDLGHEVDPWVLFLKPTIAEVVDEILGTKEAAASGEGV